MSEKMSKEEYIETKIAEGRMCDLPIAYSPMIHYDSRIKKYSEIAIYVAACALIEEGNDNPSVKEIAKLSRGHEITVMKVLRNLKKYGYLFIEKAEGKKSTYKINYDFKLDENYLDYRFEEQARRDYPELIQEMPTVEQYYRTKDGDIIAKK